MILSTTALTSFSETLFMKLVDHPVFAVATIFLAIAIWFLPTWLMNESDTKD